ncbi:MAG: HAMP domain-containing sensor histidine kinase [Armatimonadota bacterium]
MPIVPKVSMRIHLAVAILLTMVLSWILGSGISNYLNYLNFRSFHQQMIAHPDIYPKPIPQPKFGIIEFFTGRPPFLKDHNGREPQQNQSQEPNHPAGSTSSQRPQPQRPDRGPDWPSRAQFEVRSLILRLAVALGLAVLAGAWLGRRFTRPLTQLAEGAEAFQSGDFNYRIPAKGKSEFTEVATAMNVMAQQVSDQISHLEEDAERRRQFLADIAHELRSPVTTMRTMAGALQDGLADKPERRDRAVTALVGTSERLLRLVQDLMELAKLDLEDFPLDIRQADMRELIESVIRSHDDEAATAGIVLHPLEGTSSVTASIDPDRITQVLNNVVENAISYAGKGAELKIRLEGKNPIKIIISDTGKGIKAVDMPYVFDPFYRADAARTPGNCHSGLGLSIACRLVEAHGGQFSISSIEDKGTTVTILIPKQPNPPD